MALNHSYSLNGLSNNSTPSPGQDIYFSPWISEPIRGENLGFSPLIS